MGSYSINLACNLQIDADPSPDPDPADHIDANPDPAYHFDADMMWIHTVRVSGSTTLLSGICTVYSVKLS